MDRIFVAGMAALLAVIYGATAWGATYNFNFNSVEQGENGQASPTVVIRDGVAIKTADPISSEGVLSSEADVESPPTTNPPSSMAKADAIAPTPPARKWGAFDLGFFGMNQEQVTQVRLGLNAGVTLHPWKYLGVRLFGGILQGGSSRYGVYSPDDFSTFIGTEIEVVPVHVDIFGQEDRLKLSLFGGLSTLGFDETQAGSLFHGGLRARVGLTSWLGIMAQLRAAQEYAQVEAGLSFAY
jgi:hypothetical protein